MVNTRASTSSTSAKKSHQRELVVRGMTNNDTVTTRAEKLDAPRRTFCGTALQVRPAGRARCLRYSLSSLDRTFRARSLN
jgi:hypothetical protein